jgi:transposase-like protein
MSVLLDNSLDALEPKQQEAIIELLNQPTIRKVAEVIGVDEKTMYRWMKQPAFTAAYREARRQAFKQAMGMTQRFAPLAIQTLAKVMTDEKSPASSKVSAAEAILKFSRDSIELDDLEGRLEALEQQARATAGLPPAPTPTPLPPAPEPLSPPAASDDGQRRAA